jgi:hypothetical protein
MGNYTKGAEPTCPKCERRPIKDRKAEICGFCNVDPTWYQDLASPAIRTPVDDVKLQQALEAAGRYRKLYEAKIKESASEERLIRLFETAIGALPSIPKALIKPPAPAASKRKTVETPVLCFGDLHIGQVVNKSETHGINEFNFDIWQDRLEHLEKRVLDILFSHQSSEYPELVVASLGDNVSGIIHDELQKYGAQHIIDQVFVGATAVAVFLQRLSAKFKKIRYVGISGNHGRTAKGKPESQAYYKNFDYLFNSIISTRLRDNKKVVVDIPEAIFTVVEVAGHKILVSHGMELPPGSMGLPAYAINRASGGYQELLRMVGEHYDYWIMGHLHRPMELDTAIVNGCMSGYDSFAVGKMFKPIRPMQKLIGFHPHHGKAWEYQVRLDQAPKAKLYRFAHDMGAVEALQVADEIVTKP